MLQHFVLTTDLSALFYIHTLEISKANSFLNAENNHF